MNWINSWNKVGKNKTIYFSIKLWGLTILDLYFKPTINKNSMSEFKLIVLNFGFSI